MNASAACCVDNGPRRCGAWRWRPSCRLPKDSLTVRRPTLHGAASIGSTPLGLALSDPGFDHTALSEFRTRLVAGKAERLLLEALLQRAEAAELLRLRGRQRTDSTHVLAAVRVLNRLERVGETL